MSLAIPSQRLDAETPNAKRKVLILFSYAAGLPWQDRLSEGIASALEAMHPSERPEVFYEQFDSARLGQSALNGIQAEALSLKYAGVKLDAVITDSQIPAVLLLREKGLFPGVPRYFFNFIPDPQLPPGTGTERRFSSASNLERAVQTISLVLPETRRVIAIMDGSAPNESRIARLRELAPAFAPSIDLEFWTDFAVDELYEKAANLERGAVLLYFPVIQDRFGAPVVPADVARRLCAVSSVPVFSHFDTLLDTGIVGGYLVSAGQLGRLVAEVAKRGDEALPGSQSEYASAVMGYYFDARALAKWGIPESLLPPGSMVINRDDGVWARYWVYLVGIAVAFLLESALIVKLFRLTQQNRKVIAQLAQERALLEQKVLARTEELVKMNERLEFLSERDALTGLYNRRILESRVDASWRGCQRAGQGFAVVMIDIDRFKAYNDRYGHQAGDACLKGVAKVVTERARRPEDVAVRFGGEEFIVMLPHSDLEGATTVAEGIGAGVRALMLPHEASEHKVVTISLGLAWGVPTPGNDIINYIKAADEALYESKATGRNRLTVRPTS